MNDESCSFMSKCQLGVVNKIKATIFGVIMKPVAYIYT